MATPIANSLTDHAPLDNSGDDINGSEVDENPEALASVLDGTTGTTLNSASSPAMNFTNLPYVLDHKAGRVKVYNGTGSSLSTGAYVYVSGYNEGESVYEVSKAVVAESNASTLYAQLAVDGSIANGSTGYACRMRPLTAQDTSGLTAGRPVFLDTTAGSWTGALPAPEYRVQIVGWVVTVNALTGRIVQMPGQIIPWDRANTI